jgi:hypothetical protein
MSAAVGRIFTRGYLAAVADLVRHTGDTTLGKAMLDDAGIDVSHVKTVTEPGDDMDLLLEVLDQ